jgi:hypothetical protein
MTNRGKNVRKKESLFIYNYVNEYVHSIWEYLRYFKIAAKLVCRGIGTPLKNGDTVFGGPFKFRACLKFVVEIAQFMPHGN